MEIWAIGDLHLPGGDIKPMDVFGEHWKGHYDRIREDWSRKVAPEDVVLIPGDISWAMQLGDALHDLLSIAELPGRILLIRGNHDYWWSSLTQLRQNLPENMFALQNDALVLDGVVFCGTRGWNIPAGSQADAQTVKLYNRECGRLELSLKEARRLGDGLPVVAMMHYPPLYPECTETGFTKLLSDYGVSRCVYGHLHGPSIRRGFTGCVGGVRYDLVSCDALQFQLKNISLTQS